MQAILPAAVGLLMLCIHLRAALPPERRHAPFDSVKTRLDQDYSEPQSDEPNKYFHEARFDSHYDGRFGDQELNYEDRRSSLKALIQTYLSTMRDIGIETFIVQYWNRRIMPWDVDVDVMVVQRPIHHLASFYNMSVFPFQLPDTNSRRDYLLEVNPRYIHGTADSLNAIDARWIDTNTGLYIDVTTLRVNHTAKQLGNEKFLAVKDKHQYQYHDIFPLRESDFEGFPVNIPFAYTQLLVEEYGISALTETRFQNHYYDPEKKDWIAFGCHDFGTCDYYRNPTDGIHLPKQDTNAGHMVGTDSGAEAQIPRLPFHPGHRAPPPRLLDGQRWNGGPPFEEE